MAGACVRMLHVVGIGECVLMIVVSMFDQTQSSLCLSSGPT